MLNSRFSQNNSRLRRKKFPVIPLRELTRKLLIWLCVFAAAGRSGGRNRKNSRFYGNNWEFAAASGEQLLQPLGDLLGAALMREAGGEAALWVHHIDDRAVVHRIVAAGLEVLGIINPVGLGRLRDLFLCAGQRQDRSIKARHVRFERLGRV